MLGRLRQSVAKVTESRPGWSLVLAAVCYALAAFGQARLDRRIIDGLAFLALAAAAVLFAAAFGGIHQERRAGHHSERLSSMAAELSRSRGPLFALWGIALLGCLDFGRNRFRAVGLWLWLGGLLLSLGWMYLNARLAGARQQPAAGCSDKGSLFSPRHLLLLAAVVIGAWLRLNRLDIIPADIGWDLPYNYTDVLAIQRGEYSIFFPANMGREGLFFYLIALLTRFGELSHFLIKLTSALVGIATIPALYLLATELFSPAVGITAALLLAVNHWHIVLSRSGFRVILLPLFVVLLLWTFSRALRRGRLVDFGLCGLVLGLGMQTYTGFLFAPLALGAGLILYLLSGRGPRVRSLLPGLLTMAVVAVVAFAPLGRFALENRDVYLRRLGLQVEIVQGDRAGTHMTLPLLLENARTSLLMYNVYGDSNARFNVPGQRHFGFVSAILLVLGLAYALRRWRTGRNALLIALFLVMIVPMTLAMVPHEMPNVFRGAGTIGPALVLCALPLTALRERLKQVGTAYPAWDVRCRLTASFSDRGVTAALQVGRRGALALLGLLLVGAFLMAEYQGSRKFYFDDFKDALPDRQNVAIAQEIARQIEGYGDPSSAFVKGWPYWFDGRALRTYLRMAPEEPEHVFTDLISGQPPLSQVRERALFILHPADSAGLEMLRSEFGRCVSVVHSLPGGVPAFVTVFVQR
jgi:4-amino-4-deoxy-L-arabinose transferase-like glycosyltransferase